MKARPAVNDDSDFQHIDDIRPEPEAAGLSDTDAHRDAARSILVPPFDFKVCLRPSDND